MSWWAGAVIGVVSIVATLSLNSLWEWDLSWPSYFGVAFGVMTPMYILTAVWWPLFFVAVVSIVATVPLDDHFHWDLSWPRWIALYVGLVVVITIVAGFFVLALGVFA